MTPNGDQAKSLLRWFLTMAAGYLVSKGYVTGSGADWFIASGLAGGAAIWSLIFHSGPTKSTLTGVVSAVAPETADDLGIKRS